MPSATPSRPSTRPPRRQAVKQADGLRPEFIVNVGDLIEGYTHDIAEVDAEWREMNAAADAVATPFFFVPGNHDLGNDLLLTTWRKLHSSPYYTFLWICLSLEKRPLPRP